MNRENLNLLWKTMHKWNSLIGNLNYFMNAAEKKKSINTVAH